MSEISGIGAEVSEIAVATDRLKTLIFESVLAMSKNDNRLSEVKFLEFQKTLKEIQVKTADAKRHLDELKSSRHND